MTGRLLLLGGTGFLGTAMSNRLAAAGARVEPIGRAQVDLAAEGADKALADRIDSESRVVVLAAMTPPRGATQDGFDDNLRMIGAVCRAVTMSAPACLVYVSSDGVYGWADEIVDEDTRPEPLGWYPAAKHVAERMLATTAAAVDRPLLVVRPSAIFGPGDTHGAYGPNRFARSVAAGEPVELFGAGEERRDHVYVDDVAAACVGLVAAEAEGLFNIASGTSRSFQQIVDELGRVAGRKLSTLSIPRSGPIAHRAFDLRRLHAALPWFRPTPFPAALAVTLAHAERPTHAHL